MVCKVCLLFVLILVSQLQRQHSTKGLGTSEYFLLNKIFLLGLRAESVCLLMIFKESKGVKLSYVSGIDDLLAP